MEVAPLHAAYRAALTPDRRTVASTVMGVPSAPAAVSQSTIARAAADDIPAPNGNGASGGGGANAMASRASPSSNRAGHEVGGTYTAHSAPGGPLSARHRRPPGAPW